MHFLIIMNLASDSYKPFFCTYLIQVIAHRSVTDSGRQYLKKVNVSIVKKLQKLQLFWEETEQGMLLLMQTAIERKTGEGSHEGN